jgi:hypothetical protein
MKRIILIFLFAANSLSFCQTREDRAAFDRLVASHDKDIVDAVKDNALVCFSDERSKSQPADGFLVIHLATFDDDQWHAVDAGTNVFGEQDVSVKQAAGSSIEFWEHEDVAKSVRSGYVGNAQFTSYGHYVWLKDQTGKKKWMSASAPGFQASSDRGFDYIKQYMVQDETNYNASQTYTNMNKGETEWSINVRLSTGRYVERWDVTDKGQTQSHQLEEILGRCTPAKTLVETK